MNRAKLIQIAGGVWVAVGIFLIIRGVGFYQLAMSNPAVSTTCIAISVIMGLVIGGAKGKFVLAKTARKNKTRINGLEEPVNIGQVFAKSFYIFIVGMMGLGFLLRTYPHLVGGYVVVAAIYCGIGSALAVASMVYWKNEAS